MHVLPKTEIYLDFCIKNGGFIFAIEICDLSVFTYNFYSIVVELSFIQRNEKYSQKIAKLTNNTAF